MKLFYAPGACSLSPHIILREGGFTFTLEKVDIRTKKTEAGADFLTINPKGYVPALQLDDGSLLTEGPAIVQFLADQVPDKKLAPASGTLERYRLQEALNYISTELHKGFSPLFNPAFPEEGKQLTRERLALRLGHMDAQLANQPFVLGAQFSVADAYLYTVLNWSRHTKVDLEPFAALRAFHGRVADRPAVQEALKAEGLAK